MGVRARLCITVFRPPNWWPVLRTSSLFFSPASVLDARLPVYVFCLFLQESMLGNHPNVRRENTFSMKILILNHIYSVPRASSLGTFVHRMKFLILNLRMSVNYVA